MTKEKMIAELESILEEARAAVLATRDSTNFPRMRWMTPAFLRGNKDALYALTSPEFAKVAQLQQNPEVEWIFQNPALTRVINLRGRANVIDNPSICAEVLEAVQPRLAAFWHIAHERRDLVVLETVLEEAVYYLPMKGTKDAVRF